MLHARRAHMLVTGAHPSMPAPEIHHRASVLPRGAGARARHRARGVQQHHSPSEAGRKSILAQRRKGRRARGAGPVQVQSCGPKDTAWLGAAPRRNCPGALGPITLGEAHGGLFVDAQFEREKLSQLSVSIRELRVQL